MNEFEIKETKGFTVMPNYHLRDKTLSNKAKGLLSFMLSLPDNWDYSIRGLAKCSRDGVDGITTTIKELEDAGYIKREQQRGGGGTWGCVKYYVFKVPQTGKPCTEKPDTGSPNTGKPDTGSPDTEKPVQIKTKESSMKESSTKESSMEETKGADAPRGSKSKEEPVYYPQDEKLNQAFTDFVDFRKKIRKPMIDRAITLMIRKLDNMTSDNNEKIAILEQSVMNGWTTLYPLKNDDQFKQQSKPTISGASDFFDIANELDNEEGGC